MGGITTAIAAPTSADATTPDTSPPLVYSQTSNESTAENESTIEWDGTENGTISPAATAPAIEVTYEVDRTPSDPETIQVTYTAVIPESVVTLRVYPSDLHSSYSVVSTDGFTYDAATGVAEATSQQGQETTAKLTYTVDSDTPSRSSQQLDTTETETWALAGGSQLSMRAQWSYYGSPPGYESEYSVANEGYAAGGFALLGAVDVYSSVAANQSFVLVVPEAAASSTNPDAVLAALTDASAKLRTGDTDMTVTAFVAPSPIRRGGLAGGEAFWVHESSNPNTSTVWFHEYTHTRQAWTDSDFRLRAANDVEWITEASADYYGGYLAWQTGRMSADEFRMYAATTQQESAILQDSDSQSTEQKNYQKGRRVVAALDIRLRQHTEGAYTFMDLFRHLNGLEKDKLSYADLRGEVVRVTNESTGQWLDTYVTTTAAPPIPQNVTAAYNPETTVKPNLTAGLSPMSVPATTSTTVTVQVTNADTGAAVEGATVSIPSLNQSAQTDSTGNATLAINASAGDYQVVVNSSQYRETTLTLTVTEQSTSDVPADLRRFTGGDGQIGNLDVLAAVNAANKGATIGGEAVSNFDVLQVINYANG